MYKGRIRPGHVIFYIAFTIYVAAGILLYTEWAFAEHGDINSFGMLLKALRYLVYALCAVKLIFLTDLKQYHFIPLIISLVIILLALVTSRDTAFIFQWLIIVSFFDVPYEKILKVAFFTSLIILLITILCALFGVINDYVRVEGERTRHFLGFSWATYASIILFFIILEYIAMNKGKLNIVETIVLAALCLWLFKMTDARLAFAMEMLELAFFFVFGRLFGRRKESKKQAYHILLAVPWLVAIFSFFLHYLYNPNVDLWVRLNKLLSSRLMYGNAAIEKYGIHILGRPIEWIGFSIRETLRGDYNFVDCSYLRELLRSGALFLMLVLVIMTVIMKCAIDKGDFHLVWIMAFIAAFGITEMWLCASLAVDPFLACITIWGTKHIWGKERYIPYYQALKLRAVNNYKKA